MLNLLRHMIKEEARMHTNVVGNLLFLLFPLIIVIVVFMAAVFAPVLDMMLTISLPGLIVHLLFAFFGLNVGAFGLYGQDFMNRRFGSASLISYSSRTLPVSDRIIYTNVIIKDVIYYFTLFILPSVIGIELAASAMGMASFESLRLLVSLTLSFLVGLSIVFFLSTLYAHSVRLLLGFIAAFVVVSLFSGWTSSLTIFPPYDYFIDGSLLQLLYSILLILIPCFLSIVFFKISYPEKAIRFRNSMSSRDTKSVLLVKDFLDLKRSRGGFGRIIFSLVVPIAMIWVFISFFTEYIINANFLLVFSIFLGLYTSSIYSWLSEYDSFTQYSFLPILVARVIKSKLLVSTILCMVSVLIFILAAFSGGFTLLQIVLGFVCFASLFWYGLAVTIYLTGLSPNVYFFDSKNIARYLLFIVPPPILLLFLSIAKPVWLLSSLLLVLVAMYMINVSYHKWNMVEQRSF